MIWEISPGLINHFWSFAIYPNLTNLTTLKSYSIEKKKNYAKKSIKRTDARHRTKKLYISPRFLSLGSHLNSTLKIQDSTLYISASRQAIIYSLG